MCIHLKPGGLGDGEDVTRMADKSRDGSKHKRARTLKESRDTNYILCTWRLPSMHKGCAMPAMSATECHFLLLLPMASFGGNDAVFCFSSQRFSTATQVVA